MTTKTRPPAIEVFTHRNYLLFMVGLGPSAISSWMQRVGVGWLAWELTHSPAWLGMIAAAELIPFLFLSPVAGVLIDRSSPHKILLASQWLQFVHAAALAVTMFHQWLDIEFLFALTVFTGVVSAFGTSARHAVVPNTVPKALVGVAVSLDSALFQASRFIGPAIAALVIPIWGVFGAFAAHTFGSFVFSVVMQQMRMATPVRDKRSRNFMADIRESIDYIRHHDGVQPLFIMLATASICLRPMQDMLPGFAQSVFESDAVGLAWLTSAMGVGAMLSATRVALLRSFSGLHKMVFVGLACSGLATLGMVATRQLWFGIGLSAAFGYAFNTLTVSIQAIVQSAVQDSMRSRVMSLYTVIYRGTPAFGALFFGSLAEFVGLRWSYAVAGALCLLTAGVLWRRRDAMNGPAEPTH